MDVGIYTFVSLYPELMLGFSSPQFSVMEREAQQLIFKIVKENMTNVPVTIQITRVFLDDAPNSAYPDCLALGASKCLVYY